MRTVSVMRPFQIAMLEHTFVQPGKEPAWWNNQNDLVDQGSATTSSYWRCCSSDLRFNIGVITFPFGMSWIWQASRLPSYLSVLQQYGGK